MTMHSFSILLFRLERGEEIGKPDSVPRHNMAGQWPFLLGDVLLGRSRTEPEGRVGRLLPRRGSLLFGLAPGGVYPASLISQESGELLPHLFTLAETG